MPKFKSNKKNFSKTQKNKKGGDWVVVNSHRNLQ